MDEAQGLPSGMRHLGCQPNLVQRFWCDKITSLVQLFEMITPVGEKENTMNATVHRLPKALSNTLYMH